MGKSYSLHWYLDSGYDFIAAISHHISQIPFQKYHYDIFHTTKMFFQPEIPKFLIISIRNPNYYANSV